MSTKKKIEAGAALDAVAKPRRMMGNPSCPRDSQHGVEHDETEGCCSPLPACQPVDPAPAKPRRMKANPAFGHSYHGVEHDERGACSMAPACHPVDGAGGMIMEPKNRSIWNQAVDTLTNMCVNEKIGKGPTNKAFILTLRLYANEMEKLIKPKKNTK